MRELKWLALMLLICASSVSITQAQTEDEPPSLTRIGRGAVQSVEWHLSGDYILISTVTGARLYTPDLQDFVHLPDAQLATLSPDGRYIAGVDDANHIRLWDAHTLDPVDSRDTGSFRHIWTLAWSADGRYLAAAGNRDEDLIYAWDFFDAQHTVFATRYSADKLLWSPEGHNLAILNTSTGSFFVFNMEERNTTLNHQATGILPYGSSAVWQDENHLLTLIYDENTDAALWNIITSEQVEAWRMSGHARPRFSHNGISRASNVPRGVSFSRLSDGEGVLVETGEGHFGAYALAYSNNDVWLAAGTWSFSQATPAEVLVIDVYTGEVGHRLGGTQKSIQHLAWSSDNQSLVAVDEHQQLFVYDVVSGETRAYSDVHTLVGETLAWRPDSTQFVIAGSHGGFTLWDAQQEIQRNRFASGSLLPATDIKWQPNGDLVAVQMRDPPGIMRPGMLLDLELWDLSTGETIMDSFEFEPDRAISFFDWHPDGSQFVVLSEDKLHIWDIVSRSLIIESPDVHRWRDVQDLIWSPSGDYILPLMYGHGLGGSYVYSIDRDEFALSSVYLLRGTGIWTSEDELVSLRWGTWGDPTPPQSITPSLHRHAEPYDFREPDYPESVLFILQGLQANTTQGFLSPNGRYAAAIDNNDNGMLWDATTSDPLVMLADVAQVVWSPDETCLVVQRLDGSLWLLNADGTIRTILPVTVGVQEPAGIFFWSPDSSRLAHLHNGIIDLWHLGD